TALRTAASNSDEAPAVIRSRENPFREWIEVRQSSIDWAKGSGPNIWRPHTDKQRRAISSSTSSYRLNSRLVENGAMRGFNWRAHGDATSHLSARTSGHAPESSLSRGQSRSQSNQWKLSAASASVNGFDGKSSADPTIHSRFRASPPGKRRASAIMRAERSM